ncbi:MAG: radical SAM protein [Mycoplasmataceae bacterium]|jgi:uncharacterized protein|nr:radical SAM protein [Mycoplasmataceae bacterium]
MSNIEKNLNPGSYLCIVGTKCNNACKYCYNQFNGAESEVDMSIETFKAFIEFFKEHPSPLALLGGEPLFYWNQLNFKENLPILSDISNKTLRIVSNGELLTEERLKFILNNEIAMDISIDGIQTCHDRYRRTKQNGLTFNLAEKAAKELIKGKNDLRLRCTVQQNNAYKYFEMYLGMLSLGGERIGIEPESFDRWSPYNIAALEEGINKAIFHYMDLRKNSSQRCWTYERILFQIFPKFGEFTHADNNWRRGNSIAILSNGDLSINHNYPFRAKVPEGIFTVGNVFTGYNQEKINNYLDLFEDLDQNFFYASNDEGICKKCEGFNLCRNPYNTSPKVECWDNNTYGNGLCTNLKSIANSLVEYINTYGGIDKYIKDTRKDLK